LPVILEVPVSIVAALPLPVAKAGCLHFSLVVEEVLERSVFERLGADLKLSGEIGASCYSGLNSKLP
jgi:hypothetical protein